MNPIDQPIIVATETEKSITEGSKAPELRQWVKPDFQRIALNKALTGGHAQGGSDFGTLAS